MMMRSSRILGVLALVLGLAALGLPAGAEGLGLLSLPLGAAAPLVPLAAGLLLVDRLPVALRQGFAGGTVILLAGLAMIWAAGPLHGAAQGGFWALILALWALAWTGIDALSGVEPRSRSLARTTDLMVPIAFGLWLLVLWQVAVTGFGVPQVLLPSPLAILSTLVANTTTLWADFRQTFLKAVLAGYLIGCGAGLLVAILVDRVPFLQRGLLPLGNFVSALPVIGIAPIMVMWFGFDWQSKAAVVVIMTFFPMLVNAVSGLHAAGRIESELIRTYAAGYWQTLFKLRLPAAMPFLFNALKINSTLALIGAIVAEFFGTPTVGMGFRISTEVGRMALDMVWAEIVVAAVAGSAFYGLMTLLERKVTFWHPSVRSTSRSNG